MKLFYALVMRRANKQERVYLLNSLSSPATPNNSKVSITFASNSDKEVKRGYSIKKGCKAAAEHVCFDIIAKRPENVGLTPEPFLITSLD